MTGLSVTCMNNRSAYFRLIYSQKTYIYVNICIYIFTYTHVLKIMDIKIKIYLHIISVETYPIY